MNSVKNPEGLQAMIGKKVLKELSSEDLQAIKTLIVNSGDESLLDKWVSVIIIVNTIRSRLS